MVMSMLAVRKEVKMVSIKEIDRALLPQSLFSQYICNKCRTKMHAIEEALKPDREKLTQHPLYEQICTIEDIRLFMEQHVFAVWDFMSLVKKLQLSLTCTTLPWVPSPYPFAGRLINEIVWGEETDLNKDGKPLSHFEMYREAMQEIGASTEGIDQLLDKISSGQTIEEALAAANLPKHIHDFLSFTFSIIAQDKVHVVAAVFTFGREDLIPDMFIEMVNQLRNKGAQIEHLIYYLDRHIEVDGDEHGPMALKMIEELCQNDPVKISEAIEASKKALQLRLDLWNGILNQLPSPQLTL